MPFIHPVNSIHSIMKTRKPQSRVAQRKQFHREEIKNNFRCHSTTPYFRFLFSSFFFFFILLSLSDISFTFSSPSSLCILSVKDSRSVACVTWWMKKKMRIISTSLSLQQERRPIGGTCNIHQKGGYSKVWERQESTLGPWVSPSISTKTLQSTSRAKQSEKSWEKWPG